MVAWTDKVGCTRVAGVLYTLLEHNDVSTLNNADELTSTQFGGIVVDFKFDDEW